MKAVRAPSDLAINGAPPAFEDILHVGRPNIGDKADFLQHVETIFESKRLSNNGPLVHELEQQIAEYHQTRHCIAMCNGTIALEIAIRALELSGEVIIPSFTFVATAHALHWQGLTPVFADIDPSSQCITADTVRRRITPRTSGLIAVHLWGQPAPIEELTELAKQHKLKLLFDAAHAFGNSYNGRMIGQFGDAEVFSFHATKLFNTFEGGAVLTNNDVLAEKIRLMRNFGFSGFDSVIHPGTNGKMTEISAAMGLTNLKNLRYVLQHNNENFLAYKRGLTGIPGIQLFSTTNRETQNNQYITITVSKQCPKNRDELISILHAENILARKYFWPGCHRMEPYRTLYPDAAMHLEHTETVSAGTLVLPTGKQITTPEINLICDIIRVACS